MSYDLEKWRSTASHFDFVTSSTQGRKINLKISYHLLGPANAPHVLMLHGFPTSSIDYMQVIEKLGEGKSILLVDFIGFGLSDKPSNIQYSIQLQAEMIQACLKLIDWSEVDTLIAHDYGTCVAQELLLRNLNPRKIIFLNGGIYPHLHRPVLLQKMLLVPVFGAFLARLSTRNLFAKSFSKIFAPNHKPSDDEIDLHWQLMCQKNGNQISYKLLHYIADRKIYGKVWVEKMESMQDRISLVWGRADPISGEHVLKFAIEKMPKVIVESRMDLGHYPQLEDALWTANCLKR